MVIKWLSRSSVVSTVALLLLSTNNNNDVCATYQAISVDNFSKVVRIDLTKHFVPHHEIEELEEAEEENDQITIEVEDVSYAQLRTMQQGHIAKSFSKMQKSSSNLVQTAGQVNSDSTLTIDTANAVDLDTSITTEADLSAEATQATATKGKAGLDAHEKQLVSEIADASEDNKDDLALQVPLTSRNDAVYMGTVYMGSPVSQAARVVFDTGSEYLAITSSLCDDKTSGNFKFKKYDPLSGSFVQRDQLNERCKTQAYDMHKSDSNKILSKASSKLTYGSAKLQGFIWQDYTCIQPLDEGQAQKTSLVQLKLELKQKKCAYFQFLALYKAQGLGKNSDGILGLSPHKDMGKKKLHYLWSMKDNGIIDNAMVSFSVTSKEMGETPYALFGGYNSSQIEGGAEGLKTFKNFQNWLGTWALEGQGMTYGAKQMQKPGEDTSYPAIIDTGSSQLSIPPDVFEKIRAEWSAALPELDCKSDKTFCHIQKPCEEVSKKVKPVGFQMSDYVFEINPEQYLYKSDEGKCYFVIHKCRLPGKNKNLFLIGDAFLRHFYSVYDFDRDQVSLGVNIHSKGKVSMYKPGERPQDLVKTQTGEESGADVELTTESKTEDKAEQKVETKTEAQTQEKTQDKSENQSTEEKAEEQPADDKQAS